MNMRVRLYVYCLFAWIACARAPALSAESLYWKCVKDRISVVANGGAQRCDRLLGTFIRYEEILADLAGLEPDTSLPPLALYQLTRDDAQRYMFSEEERKEQRRTRYITYSKYRPGSDGVVAIALDDGSDEPIQSLLFLHGQLLLSYGVARSYPIWYQLGVAALLNGVVIKPDGTALLSRKPMFAARFETDERQAERMDLRALLEAGPTGLSPANFNETAKRAHAWAQFGLLTSPELRSGYRELALLMKQGAPLEDASQEAFGKPFAEIEAEFGSGRWRTRVSYRLPPSGPPVALGASVQLTPAEYESAMQVVKGRAAED
jgi:hypothetical protein